MSAAAALLLLAAVAQPTLELPWPCGQTKLCTQGHGGFSHNDGSYWAWDFDINVGEEVWAAASGTVQFVRESGSTGCCDPSCGWDGNYVVVDHHDGTSALYMHLHPWSVPVSVGQWVNTGDKVGEVGLTGYVCGDHLHFAVQQNCGYYYCTTIPGQFYDYGDPGYGAWLTSGNCPTPDDDGDGWNNDDDCDDGNASVHPGATEICDDGVDNDCSGGDLASEVWFTDADGDGYGAAEISVCGSPPGGTADVGGDCDDGDDTIHPGAVELCDGKDNDCNDAIDDGNPQEMGDPPPEYAATLVDASFPGALRPGEEAAVWATFLNAGTVPWEQGEVWLVPLSALDGEVSPLQHPEAWIAWDVLASVQQDVAPGEKGTIEGRVLAPEAAGQEVAETFQLSVAGDPIRCPVTEVEIAVHVRTEDTSLEPRPTGDDLGEAAGCACAVARGGRASYSFGWIAAALWFALRRRAASARTSHAKGGPAVDPASQRQPS